MVVCYLLSHRKHQLLEDVYRANFNLGHICFRRGQHSGAVRCLEQAREFARKMKDKFSESECCHSIGKVRGQKHHQVFTHLTATDGLAQYLKGLRLNYSYY